MNNKEVIDLVATAFEKMQEKEIEISANMGNFNFKRNPKYDTALNIIKERLQ